MQKLQSSHESLALVKTFLDKGTVVHTDISGRGKIQEALCRNSLTSLSYLRSQMLPHNEDHFRLAQMRHHKF